MYLSLIPRLCLVAGQLLIMFIVLPAVHARVQAEAANRASDAPTATAGPLDIPDATTVSALARKAGDQTNCALPPKPAPAPAPALAPLPARYIEVSRRSLGPRSPLSLAWVAPARPSMPNFAHMEAGLLTA